MSVALENEMTCKELVELVTDYLEHRLSFSASRLPGGQTQRSCWCRRCC